ncbi:MAG: oligosaccharide flippase family protein [Bacteroidia bacterium]|nr:oligosaccharide flippase family protein [Bacteroidia bacterium]
MSALKKLASQTVVYGASHILGRLVNYLLVPLQTRVFNPNEYGTINEFYSYVTFFIVLLTYGMETAFFRFASKEPNNPKVYSTALISLIGSSLLFVGLISLFAQPVAGAIHYEHHPEYVIYFACILSLDALASVPFAYLRQQSKPLRFALVKNTNILINILLNLYFLLLCPYMQQTRGLSLPFYSGQIGVGYVFISNLVASALTLPLLFKEIRLVSNGFDATTWKQMLAYGVPLLILGLGGMINETLDRAIMKYLLPDMNEGLRQVGIYGANYKLSILITMFIQAYRYAAEPFFFSHAANEDSRKVYARVMNYFIIICLFIFLLVTLYVDVFKYFIGPDFWEGLKVVPVLLMANVCLGVYFNLSIWYKLSDQTNKGAIISILGAIITIVLNIWWIPLYGYVGSAWATFICYFAMMLISYVWGQKAYPIPYQTGRIAAYTILALLLFFLHGQLHNRLSDSAGHLLSGVMLLAFAGAALLFERKNKTVTSRH